MHEDLHLPEQQISVKVRLLNAERLAAHLEMRKAQNLASPEERLAVALVNPTTPPESAGYRIVATQVTHLEDQRFSLVVRAQIVDRAKLASQAHEDHCRCWGPPNRELSLGEQLYEVTVASNAHPAKRDIGVELVSWNNDTLAAQARSDGGSPQPEITEKELELAEQAFGEYEVGPGMEYVDSDEWSYTIPGLELTKTAWFDFAPSDDVTDERLEVTFTVLIDSVTGRVSDARAVDRRGEIWGYLPKGKPQRRGAGQLPKGDSEGAKLFFEELLASVETLGAIAEQHGVNTLTDLMYLQQAILKGEAIDAWPGETQVGQVVQALPSAARWLSYIELPQEWKQHCVRVDSPALTAYRV